jgi:hypothetical protein
MIKSFLKSLEKHVGNDRDSLCLDSITLGFDIMSHLASKGESDELSNE